MGTVSPSKYIGLSKLQEIRDNDYMSRTGKEYCPQEIDHLINIKMTRKGIADAARSVSERDEAELLLENDRVKLLHSIAKIRLALAHGEWTPAEALIAAQELVPHVQKIAIGLGTWNRSFSLFRAPGIDLSAVKPEADEPLPVPRRSYPAALNVVRCCTVCGEYHEELYRAPVDAIIIKRYFDEWFPVGTEKADCDNCDRYVVHTIEPYEVNNRRLS